MRRTLVGAILALLIILAGTVDAARKDETKPQQRPPQAVATVIDTAIAAKLKEEKITAAANCDDAEFLRRVSLDITGKIPSAKRAKEFLDSTDPKKRAKYIDELLKSDDYGTHFATIWRDLMIRPDANMIRPPNTTPLVKWMAKEFNAGTGWNKIVSDILTVEGQQPESLYYILNGDTRGNPQANVLAGQTAQLFMGVQLACAECHQHPFQEKWSQADFWGMAAFFGKVSATGGGKKGAGMNISEKVKIKRGKRNDAPVMKGKKIVIPSTSFKQIGKAIPAQLPGLGEAKMGEDDNFRPELAKWLTAKENPYFAANAVNRLWAHFMGKGFVNPVGDMSDVNPPSHPELLKKLSKEFVDSGFDLKHMIRTICNSQAYQRTSQPSGNNKVEEHYFARQEVKVIAANVLYDTLCQALGVDNLEVKPKKAPAGKGKGKGKNKANAKKKKAAANKKFPVAGAKQQFIDFYTTKEVGGDATEYSHGIPQALRLMNSELFNTGGNTVDDAVKQGGGTAAIIETLYLSVLSRRPTRQEASDCATYVSKQRDARTGYKGVFWALINSAEFMVNR